YSGEPVTLVLRADQLKGDLRLSGKLNGATWTQSLSLADAQPAKGVVQLWARAKIGALEEQRYAGIAPDEVDKGVLKTALDFHLVSRLTSLVAVDVTPSRPAGERLDTRRIATMLPKGWDFAAVFGERAEARAVQLDKLPPGVMQAIAAHEQKPGGDTDKD